MNDPNANSPQDLADLLHSAGAGMRQSLIAGMLESLRAGKPIYLSNRPGTLENKVQSAANSSPTPLTAEDINRIIEVHFATRVGSGPGQPGPGAGHGPLPPPPLPLPVAPGMGAFASASAHTSPVPVPPPPAPIVPAPLPPPPVPKSQPFAVYREERYGRWVVNGEDGKRYTSYDTEESAQRDAAIRRRKYAAGFREADFSTPPKAAPAAPPAPPPAFASTVVFAGPGPSGPAAGSPVPAPGATPGAPLPAPAPPAQVPVPAPPPPAPGTTNPAPASAPPPPTPSTVNTPLGAFPANMQRVVNPPAPPTPTPPPTRAQRFGAAFRQAIPATAAFGGGAAVSRAAMGAFAASVPEVAIPLAIGHMVVKGLTDGARALHDFTETTVKANARLTQYNGQVAIAYTQLAIGDFWRHVDLANRTAGGTASLAKFVDEMRDSLQPLAILNQNIRNEGASFGAGVGSGFGQSLTPGANIGNWVKEQFDPNGDMANRIGKAIGVTLGDTLLGGGNPILGMLLKEGLKKIEEALGIGQPGAKPKAAPWDALTQAILEGKVGGPILPKPGPRKNLGGGEFNFGRGI